MAVERDDRKWIAPGRELRASWLRKVMRQNFQERIAKSETTKAI
jgi:hypothetical protein